MKYLLLALLIGFSFTTDLQAQGRKIKPKGILGLGALDLSSSQKKQLKEIFYAKRSEWAELKKATDGEFHVYQILKTSLENEMLEILTPAQLAKYETIKLERLADFERSKSGWEQLEEIEASDKRRTLIEKLPELERKRVLLEKKISESDKKIIDDLRTFFEVELEEWKSGRDHWHRQKEFFTTNHQELLVLNSLVIKYKHTIEGLIGNYSELTRSHSGTNCFNEENYNFDMLDNMFLLLETEGNEVLENIPVKNSLHAYPNPANDYIIVEYSVVENADIELFITDEFGNLVKIIHSGYHDLGDYTEEIDLTAFTSSLYFLNYFDEKGSSSFKFVVTSDRE